LLDVDLVAIARLDPIDLADVGPHVDAAMA
jgi:hypothetical protein